MMFNLILLDKEGQIKDKIYNVDEIHFDKERNDLIVYSYGLITYIKKEALNRIRLEITENE